MIYVYLRQESTPPEAVAIESPDFMGSLQSVSDRWFGSVPVLGFRQTGKSIDLYDGKVGPDESPQLIGSIRRMQ
jgi:hypothetical protein